MICVINKEINKEKKSVGIIIIYFWELKLHAQTLTFILFVWLVFEPELYKPLIGVSVFGSETPIMWSITFKICTKNDLYVPHLSSKIQVFTFSSIKVITFFLLLLKNIGTCRSFDSCMFLWKIWPQWYITECSITIRACCLFLVVFRCMMP